MRAYGLSEFNSRLLAAHDSENQNRFPLGMMRKSKVPQRPLRVEEDARRYGKDRFATFRRAKKKAGGRRCRPFPVTSQREEVLAGHPGEQREEVPPAGYSLSSFLSHIYLSDEMRRFDASSSCA
ncbi:hypothetical protein MESS4_340141 [Mesorhizobium sp. STM 4661]|nr:hypothetical protein MESS4_340141 [Mesorhizobium sp. STM 4661]